MAPRRYDGESRSLSKDRLMAGFKRGRLYHFLCHGFFLNFTLLHASCFEFLFYLINVYKLCVNLLKRAPRKIGSANWVTLVK